MSGERCNTPVDGLATVLRKCRALAEGGPIQNRDILVQEIDAVLASSETAPPCSKCDRLTKFEDCIEPGCPMMRASSTDKRHETPMMQALADESYPYRLRDGDIVDAKGRRITVSGNLGIAQLLNTIVELRQELRSARSATAPTLPEEPTIEMLRVLVHSYKWPADWEVGKAAQMRGVKIPYKTEYEWAYGWYKRLLAASRYVGGEG